MTAFKITIPSPCHQPWNEMEPNKKGRFCNSCAKTVIDFTMMTDEEVQDFFVAQQGQPICGKFKSTQIHRIVIELPSNVLHTNMPVWKKFLVASLLIFGTTIFPFDTTVAQDSTVTVLSNVQDSVGKLSIDSCVLPLSDTPKKKMDSLIVPELNIELQNLNDILIDNYAELQMPATLGFVICVPDSIRMAQQAEAERNLFPIPVNFVAYVSPFAVAEVPTDTAFVKKDRHGENKEPSSPKIPSFPSEFILPPVLALRKRKSKSMN